MGEQKKNILPARWTRFWDGLGCSGQRRPKILKNYNSDQDIRKLENIGIDPRHIQIVINSLSRYKDKLAFHKFVEFFLKDPETVKVWTEQSNISRAFLKLFNIFQRNSFEGAKKRLSELFYLLKLNQKGEGKKFLIRSRNRISLRNINEVAFSRILNKEDVRCRYKPLGKIETESGVVIVINKIIGGDRAPVLKFIKISKTFGGLEIKISADSKKENDLIKRVLKRIFKAFIDSPESSGSFNDLKDFLKTGESQHFLLIGTTYFQGDYIISVFPKFGIHRSVDNFGHFKQKLRGENFQESIARIKILDKEISTKDQTFIDFITPQNSQVIGAIMLKLNDRGLNSKEREKIRKDFSDDFGLSLDEFIKFESLKEKEIYKKIFQNISKRGAETELRSNESLEIYKYFVGKGLLTGAFDKVDKDRYCINPSCRLGFHKMFSGRFCKNCGGVLLSGKTVSTETIKEDRVANFICAECKGFGLGANVLSRKLLNRKICIIEVRNKDRLIEILPITNPLNDNQKEIVRFRYPNLLILTSKDDLEEIAGDDLHVEHLYDFLYALKKGDANYVKNMIAKRYGDSLDYINRFAPNCADRITNTKFYVDKNKSSKNLGAELFEADCSVLLKNMFSNSIWLGARERGKKLPDGLCALPIMDAKVGCFIWDTKFSERGRVSVGKVNKNKKYIEDAKKSQAVIDNGGIKGFVFISNQEAPRSFTKNGLNIVKQRRVKICFLRADHILKLYRHFKAHEEAINHNKDIKNIFVDSIKGILFNTAGGNKSFIVSDDYIEGILKENVVKYKKVGYRRTAR